MVDRERIYITMATIAILTSPPQQKTLSPKDLEEVLARPISFGQSPAGLVISSQRDQIEVIAADTKTNVRDLSGEKTFSQSKIPAILDFFVRTFALQISSYGINFVISVPCEEPAKWVANNILSSHISEKTGKTLIGGGGTLKLEPGHKIWNIVFGSGDDDTISVDFNASEQTQQLPDPNMLRKELQEQFDALLKFLDDLEL